MGGGATVARGSELGRGTAARRLTRARLGDADCPRSPARTAGTCSGRTGGTRNARLAQWLRRCGSGSRVVLRDHPRPNQMGLGRATGP
jgi:hypothetical protein